MQNPSRGRPVAANAIAFPQSKGIDFESQKVLGVALARRLRLDAFGWDHPQCHLHPKHWRKEPKSRPSTGGFGNGSF
jgi:hypothetical protein